MARVIANFSPSESVQRFCLNKVNEAENTKALKNICGIKDENRYYKHFRYSMVLNIEQLICKVFSTLEEEYIDLFRVEVEEDIVNLSFDLPVTNTLKIICCPLKNLRGSNTITLSKNVSMKIKHFFYPIKKKAKNFLVVQEEKDQLEKCQRSRR